MSKAENGTKDAVLNEYETISAVVAICDYCNWEATDTLKVFTDSDIRMSPLVRKMITHHREKKANPRYVGIHTSFSFLYNGKPAGIARISSSGFNGIFDKNFDPRPRTSQEVEKYEVDLLRSLGHKSK